MIQIPEALKGAFRAAGWHEDRRVAVSRDVPAGHPAAAILATLRGLTVGPCGEGETCAASDIAFGTIRGCIALGGNAHSRSPTSS
jgi:hypothetical protein